MYWIGCGQLSTYNLPQNLLSRSSSYNRKTHTHVGKPVYNNNSTHTVGRRYLCRKVLFVCELRPGLEVELRRHLGQKQQLVDAQAAVCSHLSGGLCIPAASVNRYMCKQGNCE